MLENYENSREKETAFAGLITQPLSLTAFKNNCMKII